MVKIDRSDNWRSALGGSLVIAGAFALMLIIVHLVMSTPINIMAILKGTVLFWLIALPFLALGKHLLQPSLRTNADPTLRSNQ